MSAAILQGVPATTLDTDLWIDLPERQYNTILNISRELGATIMAPTVVGLSDDTIVNFIYRLDGLGSFQKEYSTATRLKWFGMTVVVLPLPRVIRSKKACNRPKDIAHLPLLEQVLKAKRRL